MLVFVGCRFCRCLCSQVAVLVGACVPWFPFCLSCSVGGAWVLRYRFLSMLVLPSCRFGRLVSLVTVLVGACVP